MKHAKSLITGEKVNVQDWELFHKEDTPICLVCSNELYVKAHPSPDVTTHFSHYKNPNCPLVKDHHQRYQILGPGIQDKENGEQIKQLFVNNIGLMFAECKRVFGDNFPHALFKEMVKKATERNIWFYKGLKIEYVPYVLLVNYGIFKKTDKSPKMHFVLDANLTNYDELWNKPKEVRPIIWRVFTDSDEIEEYQMNLRLGNTKVPHYFIDYIFGLQSKKESITTFLEW
ncbi:hypothetical protein QJ133_00980 [Priestia megaterium]|uniref:hypothetical protein n=1 Tax=Priestia megaterium TaxID=1404 RepID=UPI00249C1CCB|nr:hypothetical protein [Priestia megaterium]MDI3089774.1 hypothetical protein [Priestia megaterium]